MCKFDRLFFIVIVSLVFCVLNFSGTTFAAPPPVAPTQTAPEKWTLVKSQFLGKRDGFAFLRCALWKQDKVVPTSILVHELRLKDATTELTHTMLPPHLLSWAKQNQAAIFLLGTQGGSGTEQSLLPTVEILTQNVPSKTRLILTAQSGTGAAALLLSRMIEKNNPVEMFVMGGVGDQKSLKKIPGLLICTEEKLSPRTSIFQRFAEGRTNKAPWTWAHVKNKPASEIWAFAAEWMQAVRRSASSLAVTVDNGSREELLEHQTRGIERHTSWLPARNLLENWKSVHVGEGAPPEPLQIHEFSVNTRVESQPELQFFLRMPPELPKDDPRRSEPIRVMAFCTWESGRDQLLARMQGDDNQLVALARKHRMALLTWNTSTLWKSAKSHGELDAYTNRELGRNFRAVASAWDEGLRVLSRKHNLSTEDIMLYGFSRGAHWSLRLALERPTRFFAVHVHAPNSFDKPNPAANKVLWMLTSGNLDRGRNSAANFYWECRSLNYPIIFKRELSLNHKETANSRRLSLAFFEYAIGISKHNQEIIRQAHAKKVVLDQSLLIQAAGHFEQAPFVADYVNEVVFPISDIERIPPYQRVPLPNEQVAKAWGIVLKQGGGMTSAR